MKFLKILFYNSYHYQMKYSHKDIPVFVSYITILGVYYLYFLSISTLIDWLFIPGKHYLNFNNLLSIGLTFAVGVAMFCILFRKKQYKKVIDDKSLGTLKYKIVTFTFLLGGFILYFSMFVVMWAMNNSLIHPISFN